MKSIKEMLEKKYEIIKWYEVYVRLFGLLKTDEDKKKLNEAWKRMKQGLGKLYE